MAKRLSRAHFLILSTTPEGRITAGGWLVTSVHRLPNPITNICQQRQLKMQLDKKQPNKTANVNNKITQHLSFQSSSNIETCYYVTWHVASRKKRFLAAALLQRQYDVMTTLAATLQPISVQKAVSIQRANTKSIQKAQLSPSDRAMRLVSSNLANYYATVQKLLIRQVLTKPMV